MIHDIPLNVQRGVVHLLGSKGTEDLLQFSFSGGGCINPGGKLVTKSGTYFLKWNSAVQFPLMFEREAKGLQLLFNAKAIRIPEVIGVGQDDANQYLLLAFIEQGPYSRTYSEELGQQLAQLHRSSDSMFGLDHDNYIGSLTQFNKTNSSWVDFFMDQRLDVQLKLARDAGLAESQMMKSFEALYSKLPSLLPDERPSLLHGDLWSGNVITTLEGTPCLIDPAVYYGSREMDLAMTRLFGSFPGEFYESYHQAFPLIPGYDKRVDLYNLYPLLVHLNLFGLQYRPQITGILKTFI